MTKGQLSKEYKAFEVSSISREDLISQGYNKEEVMALSDENMKRLANKLGDSLMEAYWISLDIMAKEIFDLNIDME